MSPTTNEENEMDYGWRSNLKGTKQHLALSSWTERGTGIVARCDKQGIFLTDVPGGGLPKCKACAKR